MDKSLSSDSCTVSVMCHCGCSNGMMIKLRITDDEEIICLESLVSGFFAHQTGLFQRIKRRIRAAWFMLCGKEYSLHEVMLSKEEFIEYVDAINRMYRKIDNIGVNKNFKDEVDDYLRGR